MKLISTEKLQPNSYNPNHMSDEDFNSLVESIRNAGFLEANPILARPLNGSFEIVDGEHRWRASKQLGIKEVPCDVREMDDLTAHRLCVILNKDRGAPDYFKLSKLFNEDLGKGLQQKDLVIQYGYAKPTVSLIVPIYPKLNKISEKFNRLNFTNKDIMLLARVDNDLFRYALVERAVGWPSALIQETASKCNKVSDYIDTKTTDSELRKEIINKLLKSDLIFKESSLDALKNEVDSIVDMPVRYIPRFITADSLKETAKPFKHPVHLILTSPPYGDLKDYGEAGQVTSKKGYEKYLKMMEELWENCFGLVTTGGRMVVVVGDEVKASGTDSPHRVIPIHADIIRQCLDTGFIFLDTIIWQKVNTSESAGGGAFMGSYPYPREVLINRDHEYILIFRKPGDTPPPSEAQKEASKMAKNEWSDFITSIWKTSGEDKKLHPAAFTEKIAERLIKMFSFAGEYVLDTFSGSGTTCVSAMRLGRRSIGIDLKEEYIKISIERVEEVKKKEKDFRYVSED